MHLSTANIQLFNHALQRLHDVLRRGNNQGITVFAGGDGDNLTPATDRAFRLFFSRRERAADLLQYIDQIFGFAVFEIENLAVAAALHF